MRANPNPLKVKGILSTLSRLAAINSIIEGVKVLTMERLAEESSKDQEINALAKMIKLGCPEEKTDWPTQHRAYLQQGEKLTVMELSVI